jgi:hypothetical protein
MIEFIHEAVNVEAQLAGDGTLRPQAFTWQGRRYPIETWGRQESREEEGRTLRCYLVQTASSQTWELCHDEKRAQWTLTRHWARHYGIV